MPEIDSGEESTQRKIEFSDCVLDLARGVLRRSGQEISLRPQSYALLLYLVEHRGVLVSKDSIVNAVWQDTPVTDDSITQCILEIRKAIGDASRTIVRTVPKRGYIFDAAVSASGKASGAGESTTRTKLLIAGALGAVALLSLLLWVNYAAQENAPVESGPDSAKSPVSIAVLAFRDMSERQDQQYFGDGIADEILTQLALTTDMTVIARTSSFAFREENVDIPTIGKELNVDYVLEGSVRKSGGAMRITAQLIETTGGTHVWADIYDHEATAENLLKIQNDVASHVSAAILSSTMSSARPGETGNTTSNTEALDLYLEGMHFLRQIEIHAADVYEDAINLFEAAIELDPNWAAPREALGRTHLFHATYRDNDNRDESYTQAMQHVEDAIRLNPDSGAAYATLGTILFRGSMEFAGAERAFSRARELGAKPAWGEAMLYRMTGRYDEAIERYRQAIRLDPLAEGPRGQLAYTYLCADQFEESFEQFEKLQAIVAQKPGYDPMMAYLQLKLGNVEKSREIFQPSGDPASDPEDYGLLYALSGMEDEARQALEIAETSGRGRVEFMASTAMVLGDKERALHYLESAYEIDPRKVRNIRCAPELKPLHGDPRFERLMQPFDYP